MISYRYVSQGEYFITDDPNTVLVTSGMTECIATEFIDKKNPSLRLLTHLDGLILYNEQIAFDNINKIVDAFKTKNNNNVNFDIYVLGGDKNRRNCRLLFEALDKINLKMNIAHFQDSADFCKELNSGRNSVSGKSHQFDSMNADLTMVCRPGLKAEFISYTANALGGFSEDQLIAGDGLSISANEKEKYTRFLKANKKILDQFPNHSINLRQCNDIELLEEVESAQEVKLSQSGSSFINSLHTSTSDVNRYQPPSDLYSNDEDFSSFGSILSE